MGSLSRTHSSNGPIFILHLEQGVQALDLGIKQQGDTHAQLYSCHTFQVQIPFYTLQSALLNKSKSSKGPQTSL